VRLCGAACGAAVESGKVRDAFQDFRISRVFSPFGALFIFSEGENRWRRTRSRADLYRSKELCTDRYTILPVVAVVVAFSTIGGTPQHTPAAMNAYTTHRAPSLREKPSLASLVALTDDPRRITFNNITGEHNYRECTFFKIMSYIFLIAGIILQLLFLASDVYTLIQIYALKNWDSSHTITYIPILAYKIVFTVCIGISFIYFIFVWVFGAIIQRRNGVVSSFLHTGARQIDSLKSYERFCIYEEIQSRSLHEWLCLSIYTAYHYEIISWLLADTPRQILNGATIAYVVSNKFTSGNIKGVISEIGQNEKKEAVLLSFMFFSFVVWLLFTFKNVIVILSSICIISSSKSKNNKSFNAFCYDLVFQRVSQLYAKKATLKEEELAKRRKVPSFLQNGALDEYVELDKFDLGDIEEEENFGAGSSFDVSSNSMDKGKNDIQLKILPVSHSRVDLIPKTSRYIYQHPNENEYSVEDISQMNADPFVTSTNNSRYHADAFYSKPSHHPHSMAETLPNAYNNNNIDMHAIEQIQPQSQANIETQQYYTQVQSQPADRQSYVYVPSKVYEEEYHSRPPISTPLDQNINMNMNMSVQHSTSSTVPHSSDYIPHISSDNEHVSEDGDEDQDEEDEEEEDYGQLGLQNSTTNRHTSAALYGSRGLGLMSNTVPNRRDIL
jgi:hypothetical protein